MKKAMISGKILMGAICFLLTGSAISCSQSHRNEEIQAGSDEQSISSPTAEDFAEEKLISVQENKPEKEISSQDPISSPTTRIPNKFIRKADIRFKAKDADSVTYQIEEIAVVHGGFVTMSDLESQVNYTRRYNISKDSVLEVTNQTIRASLTLRIPNANLDTTLKDIAKLIDFLDYRRISANDVTLNILANDLAQTRLKKNEQRLANAIDSRGRRLNETTSAEELLLQKQEQADRTQISNLSLADQINFSTITIQIYENPKNKKEYIEKELEYKEYEYKPGLGERMADSLSGGWDTLCSIIVSLTYIWWIFVVAALIIIGIKYYSKRKSKIE